MSEESKQSNFRGWDQVQGLRNSRCWNKTNLSGCLFTLWNVCRDVYTLRISRFDPDGRGDEMTFYNLSLKDALHLADSITAIDGGWKDGSCSAIGSPRDYTSNPVPQLPEGVRIVDAMAMGGGSIVVMFEYADEAGKRIGSIDVMGASLVDILCAREVDDLVRQYAPKKEDADEQKGAP